MDTQTISVPGLVTGSNLSGISEVSGWPAKSSASSIGLKLPAIMEVGDVQDIHRILMSTFDAVTRLEDEVDSAMGGIAAKFESITGVQKKTALDKISKLQDRINVLKREIDSINLKLTQTQTQKQELEKIQRSRMKAIERDENRINSLKAQIDKFTGAFNERRETLSRTMSRVQDVIDRIRPSIDSIVAVAGGIDMENTAAHLLIPFIAVGFSKKGRLRIEIYPPSRLVEEPQLVGRRKEFSDPFAPASKQIEELSKSIEKRSNKDIGIRKYIREQSKEYNLLALSASRAVIRKGVEALISDGFAKSSVLKDLEGVLAGVPEIMPSSAIVASIDTHVVEDSELCSVKVHIYDESGTSITNAELELGAMNLKSDSRGMIKLSLPRSNYEGTVTALGYKPRNLEFTLRSSNDVSIPIVLAPLSKEELLDQELDTLLDRSKKIEQIRERLWMAFEKQGRTLLNIPAYRNALVELLSELGYEPEAWIAQAKKRSGMVKGLLRRDDREEGIRRDILRIAGESREAGGIMLFSEVLIRLDDLGWETSSSEVEGIIQTMSKEGIIEGLTTLESGSFLVNFIPVSLTDDPQKILGLASERNGRITLEDAVVELGWKEERVKNALELLILKGVAKIHKSYSKSTQYYFPGFRGKK
ncbi:MAG: hypothetical protein ACFE7R_04960 [Candidatus Hodarchaeota archaeon]